MGVAAKGEIDGSEEENWVTTAAEKEIMTRLM